MFMRKSEAIKEGDMSTPADAARTRKCDGIDARRAGLIPSSYGKAGAAPI
jgi:hypothetical protein